MIAKYIDHTILKPTTTLEEVNKVCEEAIRHQFASVCVPPYFVANAAAIMQGASSSVCTVIGFPFGYSNYNAKAIEARKAVKDGATELDMVMNIAAFRDKNYQFLKQEIQKVIEVISEKKLLLKVIIESGILSDEEIIFCCKFYKDFDVQFLKTSTGYAEKGSSIEAIALMKQHLPSYMQIKASGGIKTFAFAQALLNAGATRLGCSASVAIINSQETSSGGH
jgi:deoxyribose-phosphate aldolase